MISPFQNIVSKHSCSPVITKQNSLDDSMKECLSNRFHYKDSYLVKWLKSIHVSLPKEILTIHWNAD